MALEKMNKIQDQFQRKVEHLIEVTTKWVPKGQTVQNPFKKNWMLLVDLNHKTLGQIGRNRTLNKANTLIELLWKVNRRKKQLINNLKTSRSTILLKIDRLITNLSKRLQKEFNLKITRPNQLKEAKRVTNWRLI